MPRPSQNLVRSTQEALFREIRKACGDTELARAITKHCHEVPIEYADWLPVWSKMTIHIGEYSFRYDQVGCSFFNEISEEDLLELAQKHSGWEVFNAAIRIRKGILFVQQQKDTFTYEHILEHWGWMLESDIPCIKRIINTNYRTEA